MERVTGIGGVFFKSQDPAKLKSWYRENLGIEPQADGYVVFSWREQDRPDEIGQTVWEAFRHDTRYFEPSQAPFMVNYRVRNLDRMLEQLRTAGVQVYEKQEVAGFGWFAWAMDPEGNRIELWEPPARSSS